jgi:hypothetical protein
MLILVRDTFFDLIYFILIFFNFLLTFLYFLTGGRSLRYTAELIYCTSCTNPEWSKDKDYIRIKKEINKLYPMILPVSINNQDMYDLVGSDDHNKNIIINSDEEIFNDVGGGIIWKNFVTGITL